MQHSLPSNDVTLCIVSEPYKHIFLIYSFHLFLPLLFYILFFTCYNSHRIFLLFLLYNRQYYFQVIKHKEKCFIFTFMFPSLQLFISWVDTSFCLNFSCLKIFLYRVLSCRSAVDESSQLCFSEEVIISPSLLEDIFAGHRSMG